MEITKSQLWIRKGVWQLEYHALFNNSTQIQKVSVSTKVKTDEKSREWMERYYVPAKLDEEKKKHISPVIKEELKYFHDKYLQDKRDQGLISIDKTLYRSKAAIEFFGANRKVESISVQCIKDYLTSLYVKNNLNKETIKSYLYQLSGMLQIAVDSRAIAINPAKQMDLKFLKSVKNLDAVRPFLPEEVKILLENSFGIMRNYLGLAFNTGMSPEEILGLMPKDIDFVSNTIKIKRVVTKGTLRENSAKTNHRLREIRLFRGARSFIEEQMKYAKERNSLFIFCRDDGSRLNDIQELRGQLKNQTKWNKLLKDCNIEYRPIKNTRHTWAVQSIKSSKMTLQQIADTLGHANLRMLIQTYAAWINGAAKDVDSDIEIYNS